jgi:hypothetical protein
VKVAVLFDNLGPYYHARLAAAAQVCELTAIEERQSVGPGWSIGPGRGLARPRPGPPVVPSVGRRRGRLEQ